MKEKNRVFYDRLSISKIISRLLVGAIALGCFLSLSHAADVYLYHPEPTKLPIKQDNCFNYVLEIRGEITQGDDVRFSQKIKELLTTIRRKSCDGDQFKTRLISEGGNVSAALALGRVIRKADVKVIVPFDSNCLSSCVFVLLAGVDRESYGKVGVHRPYFEHLSENADAESVRKARDYFLSGIRAYLTEMDVSPQLLDIMLSVPPENMRTLTTSELLELRIIGIDANFDERQVAKEAWIFGLTSAEYRKRRSIFLNTCPHLTIYGNDDEFLVREICQLQTMLNISREEAKRRNDRSDRCLNKPEQNTFQYAQCLRFYYLGK